MAGTNTSRVIDGALRERTRLADAIGGGGAGRHAIFALEALADQDADPKPDAGSIAIVFALLHLADTIDRLER